MSEFDIVYRLRSAIKGQILANFIAELSDVLGDASSGQLWILEKDGSFKKARGGVGTVLQSSERQLIAQVVQFSFRILNNEAEYEAVLLRLQLARVLSTTQIEI